MQTGGVQDDQAGAGLDGTARVSLSNSSLTGQAPKLNRVGKNKNKGMNRHELWVTGVIFVVMEKGETKEEGLPGS